MSDYETEIHNVHTEMENFLRSVARKEPSPSQPIYLRVEYKNGLKLLDKEKHQFSVDESFLSAFRDIYTDKSCTPVSTQSRPSASTTGNLNWSLSASAASP